MACLRLINRFVLYNLIHKSYKLQLNTTNLAVKVSLTHYLFLFHIFLLLDKKFCFEVKILSVNSFTLYSTNIMLDIY